MGSELEGEEMGKEDLFKVDRKQCNVCNGNDCREWKLTTQERKGRNSGALFEQEVAFVRTWRIHVEQLLSKYSQGPWESLRPFQGVHDVKTVYIITLGHDLPFSWWCI